MRRSAAALLGVALLPALALAQVYRWEDQRGTVHYSNTPEREPEAPRASPPLPSSPVKIGEMSPAPVSPSVAITRIPYTPGVPILVKATIGGAGSLMLILDTGADRTMVAPEALWKLGISTVDAPRVEVRGVTGSSQGQVIQVASLEVGAARAGPLWIIAHDAELKKADGLLGRDFLEHFKVTIDSRERLVTLVPK
jgi:Aspartyl protease/Domain of unknown function (DUF4124)